MLESNWHLIKALRDPEQRTSLNGVQTPDPRNLELGDGFYFRIQDSSLNYRPLLSSTNSNKKEELKKKKEKEKDKAVPPFKDTS